jgi:H+-transporting ATPase
VLGTQTIATLIAVYGIFMAPLGWKWAGLVWAYALVWALINDRVKLLAYRIFDPSKPSLLEKKPVDRTSEIAARAYELYQQRAHGESQQDQDWLEAERETRGDQPAGKKTA